VGVERIGSRSTPAAEVEEKGGGRRRCEVLGLGFGLQR
jgi:hypothetical protein